MFINTNKTDERSLLEQHEGYWDYHAKQVHSTALPCARARACTFFYCITLNLYTSFYFVTTDLVATKFMYIDSACSAMVLKGLCYMYVSLVVACCLQALICYKCPHIPNPIMKKAPA
jgi:hypothetical protein